MSKLDAKLKPGKSITHGGYSFIATGKLPQHRRYILRYLSACRDGLIHDLGGENQMTTAQLIIVDRIISKLGLIRCVEENIKENSVIVRGELAPVLKASYLAYSNSLRLDLMALGINERSTDRALTPLQYIEQFDKAKEEREKRAGKRASK